MAWHGAVRVLDGEGTTGTVDQGMHGQGWAGGILAWTRVGVRGYGTM